MDADGRDPGPAGEFIIVRLVELVEILRMPASDLSEHAVVSTSRGLLHGLRDPVTAKALRAMHTAVGHDWTVESLAKLCGVSRSAFVTRFHAVVGVSPIAYLLRRRMALAKEALGSGTARMEEVAFSIGDKSGSAFSTAFTRAVGCSPRQFAESSTRCA